MSSEITEQDVENMSPEQLSATLQAPTVNIAPEKRSIPANNIDLEMQLIEPTWQSLSPGLRAILIKKVGESVEGTVRKEVYQELSGILALFTRDVRLGNLSPYTGEYDFVIYYLELASDFLHADFPQACVTAMIRALSRLEPSSSKSGPYNLRRLLQTFTQEHVTKDTEPEKRSPIANKSFR